MTTFAFHTRKMDTRAADLVKLLCETHTKKQEGKEECKVLQQQLNALKTRILKEMQQKNMTAVQLDTTNFLLRTKIAKERVLKQDVIDREVGLITATECTAMYDYLVQTGKDLTTLTTATVYKAALKARLHRISNHVTYHLKLASKVRKEDVIIGQMPNTDYLRLHHLYRTALTKRKLLLKQLKVKDKEAERRGRALLQGKKRLHIELEREEGEEEEEAEKGGEDDSQSLISASSMSSSSTSSILASALHKKPVHAKVNPFSNRLPSPIMEGIEPTENDDGSRAADLISLPTAVTMGSAAPQLVVTSGSFKAEATKPLSANQASEVAKAAVENIVGKEELFSVASLAKLQHDPTKFKTCITKGLANRKVSAMKDGIKFSVA